MDKEYVVMITQYCVPIRVFAKNEADAEYQARNNYTWEPNYAEVEVKEISDEDEPKQQKFNFTQGDCDGI